MINKKDKNKYKTLTQKQLKEYQKIKVNIKI